MTAQVLLGRAHRRFLFDGPRLAPRGVGQQDALAANAGRDDLPAIDAIQDVADRHAGLVPDGVGPRVTEEPEAADDEQAQHRERGHGDPLAAQARWDPKTVKERFHWLLNPSP